MLANTSNQYANTIGESIALKILGMPLPPDRDLTKKVLADEPVTAAEQKALLGTYSLRLAPDPLRHKSYDYYKRTVRVMVEHGQLQFQKLGDTQESLFKQADGSYAGYSAPTERITFEIKDGKAISITISDNGKPVSICTRVGNESIATFHAEGLKVD